MPKVDQIHLDARRQQIINAARDRFASNGFARTSINDLVEAAGLSVGAIYRYFTSKDEIIVAICEQSSHALPSELTATTIAEFLDHIRDLAREHDHAKLISQIYAEAAVHPALAAVVQRQLADLRQAVAARVSHHDREHAEQLAETFVSLCHGYTQQLAVRGDVDPAPYINTLTTMISTQRVCE